MTCCPRHTDPRRSGRYGLPWAARGVRLLGLILMLAAGPDAAAAEPSRGLSRVKSVAMAKAGYAPARLHALLVGVGKYKNHAALPGAAEGCEELARVLQDRYGFGSVRVLLNGRATREAMLEAFDDYTTLGKGDSLLVFFAGRSWVDPQTGMGYWLPADATKGDRFSYVSQARVARDFFLKYGVHHLLVVSDSRFACGVLGAHGAPASPGRTWAGAFGKPSRWALVSNAELPAARLGEPFSPFTTALVDSLTGPRGPACGIQELYAGLRKSSPTPVVASPFRTPGHMPGGEFVLSPLGTPLGKGQAGNAANAAGLAESTIRFGALVVTSQFQGVLYLDGERIGTIQRGETIRLHPVAVGARVIRIVDIKRPVRPWETTVLVMPDREPELVANSPMPGLEPANVAPEPGKPWTIPAAGIRLMPVAAGWFTMGSPPDELRRKPDESQHEVELTSSFWIGAYEVTQQQYEAITGLAPSQTRGGDLPVTGVNWQEARSFCRTLTSQEAAAGRLPEGHVFRLPTEAEWEYCCRAGTATAYCSGDIPWHLPAYAWCEWNSDRRTHAVGSKRPNAWGLYDMHGNVMEWCLDRYGPHSAVAATDPVGPATGRWRVVRGGSALTAGQVCRSAARLRINAPVRGAWYGFRIVLGLPCGEQSPVAETPTQSVAKPVRAAQLAPAGGASPRPGHAWTVPGMDLPMVCIKPGSFVMGGAESSPGLPRHPAHRVTLTRPYWIGKYEVTQAQFAAVTGENPSEPQGEQLPANRVTWYDAAAFCQVLTKHERKANRLPASHHYRLPTDAEWEYACRAGTTTRHHFGDAPDDLPKYANCGVMPGARVGGKTTVPVGSYLPNPWGLHDMYGNVSEWCLDHYAYHPSPPPQIDPVGRERSPLNWHFERGGGRGTGLSACASAARSRAGAEAHGSNQGFRLVLGPITTLEAPLPPEVGKSWRLSILGMDMFPMRESQAADPPRFWYSGKPVTQAQFGVLTGYAARKESQWNRAVAGGRATAWRAFCRKLTRVAREGQKVPADLAFRLLSPTEAARLPGSSRGTHLVLAPARQPPLLGGRKPPAFGKSWTVPSLDLRLRPVPAGRFVMGSPRKENGRIAAGDAHPVRLTRPFWLGACEVTQGQYEAIMDANPGKILHWRLPVTNVSWTDAVAFCERLTALERKAGRLPRGYAYRLPTEAEWEYCCRAGTRGPYSCGEEDKLLEHEWLYPNARKHLQVVGGKKPNPAGFYDMGGNAAEWCLDWYGGYLSDGEELVDPQGLEVGARRALRGGSCYSRPEHAKSAKRESGKPAKKKGWWGFRVALAPAVGP